MKIVWTRLCVCLCVFTRLFALWCHFHIVLKCGLVLKFNSFIHSFIFTWPLSLHTYYVLHRLNSYCMAFTVIIKCILFATCILCVCVYVNKTLNSYVCLFAKSVRYTTHYVKRNDEMTFLLINIHTVIISISNAFDKLSIVPILIVDQNYLHRFNCTSDFTLYNLFIAYA